MTALYHRALFRHITLPIAASLGLLLGVSLPAQADVIGHAYSQQHKQADKLLYSESHQYQATEHHVVYRSAQGKAFARKRIEYRDGWSTPDVEFSNDHCKESYELEHHSPAAKKNDQQLTITYRNGCDKKTLSKSLDLAPPYVVDAGFDHYIRDNIKHIQQRKMSFTYPLPSRASDVVLTAVKQNCDDLEALFEKNITALKERAINVNEWHQCVRIRPKSWIISQFFPPIYLAYNAQTKLRLYAGKSNIGDAQGEFKNVIIFYQDQRKKLVIK